MILTLANGQTIDALAVATDDLILTAVARMDLLSTESLRWLMTRFDAHALECEARGDRAARLTAQIFFTLADLCGEHIALNTESGGK